MRIDSKAILVLENVKAGDLAVHELVDILISRYIMDDGWRFVSKEQQSNLFEILNSIDE